MLIYLQWAKSSPEDWSPLDVHDPATMDWLRSVARPEPDGTQSVDGEPGWVNAMNCQGIGFSGDDHSAIEALPDGSVRITGWMDDPEDHGETRLALEWTLCPAGCDPRQRRRVWGTEDMATLYGDQLRPWSEFTPPSGGVTLHGIWLTEELLAQHRQVRTPHGWGEWA